jgi:DNA-binding Lrp family transcriptional regulator
MEQEYKVLAHLQENKKTIQLKISKGAGISFSAVNLFLKKMVRKGLIKIEKLNARAMNYNLAPKGMQKTRLTYRYINQIYNQILKVNQALDCLLAASVENQNGKEVQG